MDAQPSGADESDRFDYFMIRLSHRGGAPERVAGQIERLGTGEKRSFDTGEGLLELFALWRAGHINMGAG